jgi:hypothetical protein
LQWKLYLGREVSHENHTPPRSRKPRDAPPLAEIDLPPAAPQAFAAPDGNAFAPPISRFETAQEDAALDWWFAMRKSIDENQREF